MALRPRYISLFSGVGGLDLAVQLAVPEARCVCYVEGEAYAAAVLVARMEEGSLDKAPIWSDVRSFDGTAWCGRVDLVVGGFPCQDLSLAGRGAGLSGSRSGLWFEYARIIREVQPKYVFVENVPPLVNRGLYAVLGSLAEAGYDAEWGCLSAESVGAPHIRERFFLFAYKKSEGRGQVANSCRELWEDTKAGKNSGDSTRSEEREFAPSSSRGSNPWGVGNGDVERLSHDVGERQHDEQELSPLERAGGRIFPPRPKDISAWGQEKIGSQPCIHRETDGMAHRVDRIRACGNGVVAIQGAAAFTILSGRARGIRK